MKKDNLHHRCIQSLRKAEKPIFPDWSRLDETDMSFHEEEDELCSCRCFQDVLFSTLSITKSSGYTAVKWTHGIPRRINRLVSEICCYHIHCKRRSQYEWDAHPTIASSSSCSLPHKLKVRAVTAYSFSSAIVVVSVPSIAERFTAQRQYAASMSEVVFLSGSVAER